MTTRRTLIVIGVLFILVGCLATLRGDALQSLWGVVYVLLGIGVVAKGHLYAPDDDDDWFGGAGW